MTEETSSTTSEETFLCDEIVFHKQEGRPDVFVANKGDRIPLQVAVNLGLVAGTKAIRSEQVQNKAIKPAKTQKPIKTPKD